MGTFRDWLRMYGITVIVYLALAFFGVATHSAWIGSVALLAVFYLVLGLFVIKWED